MANTEAPYGTWHSPVDAALVAAHDGSPEYLGAVGAEVWWTEPRPQEGGRRALMRLREDREQPAESVLPAPWNVRNRMIEYGGLPWAGVERPTGGPLVVFTHFADQRLYAFAPDDPATEPWPLTPLSAVGEGLRWCDPVVRPEQGDVTCVLEEFTGEGPTELRRLPVSVPLDGSAAEDRGGVRELTPATHRFLTGPRFSPDGRQAAWLAWDHPSMPWDGTLLRLAEVDADGGFLRVRTVAGGTEESVAQVEWAADGSLLFASDRTGWWNLHRLEPDGDTAVNLCPCAEEFAGGLWRIGYRWFVPLLSGLVAVLHGQGGMVLGVLDPDGGEVVDMPGPWTEWSASLAVSGSRVVGIAAGAQRGHEIVELDTRDGHGRVIARPHQDAVHPDYYPQPQVRVFRGPDGREVHGNLYPPRHPELVAPEGELPPYAVWVHGGPTSRSPLVLDLEIAYFTSRGIGVVEVNYGGSTGYGREYRNRLREQWGVVDVMDCATAARALAAEGVADPERIAIRGGSAGGWTSAASLTSPDTEGVYACGTISYPILDLEGWAEGETHDFESQYLESLVGPLAEQRARYRDRSPAAHAERVSVPFLLLQGLDDVICPPVQCERFLDKVTTGSGAPHAYLTFEGEGHGFRRADSIVRAVEAELALYDRVFGLNRQDVPALELTE
ncbi:prolyl oligopeptidase family serine peptidase [Streptomyces oceani]|uniref:Acyl-peptide hydrolase n=1 Tax=Streptomyces oceani TaxID=1075402 RepID=A0A1E7KJV6_9ACTN|nr:prolyl oligopeptidase family serine peptidase [Streptomyces oceani]OEV04200.1 acyl-peptide hydrolase [Streptomyces oceani]